MSCDCFQRHQFNVLQVVNELKMYMRGSYHASSESEMVEKAQWLTWRNQNWDRNNEDTYDILVRSLVGCVLAEFSLFLGQQNMGQVA